MTSTTTAQAPAERTVPGIGYQRVNLYKDGAYYRQVRDYGTVAQARAAAEMSITPHCDGDNTPNPRYYELLAIARG